MQKLKELVFTFASVTTCILMAAALFISIFWKSTVLNVDILWQILICSLICSLGNLLYREEERTKKQFYILLTLHYIYINIVVLSCGFLFGWFLLDDIAMVAGMVMMIAIIFIFLISITQHRSKKNADIMNQKLKEYIQKKHP